MVSNENPHGYSRYSLYHDCCCDGEALRVRVAKRRMGC